VIKKAEVYISKSIQGNRKSMKTTVKYLSEHTKGIIERAAHGEEVIIIHEGKPFAKLVSLDSADATNNNDDNLFCIWQDHPGPINTENYLRQIRQRRSIY
jgi:antitoxin (DNA-binding transcriptional repressor) of toxin-antitoxin stability system